MASIPVLALALLISVATVVPNTRSCNIEDVRQSAQTPMPGGWSPADVNDENVLQLKNSAADRVADVNKALHVIEAYQQTVAGTNYCIRFGAAGHCSDLHCQGFECVAGGHRPLPQIDGELTGPTPSAVNCQNITTCDISRIRQSAENPMPGGWHDEPRDSEMITDLHNKASAVAGLKKGTVVEAYSQTVAGFNYCIRFDTSGAENCASNCQPRSCVAGGYRPLPHTMNDQDVMTKVGIKCQAQRRTGAVASADNGALTVIPVLTTIVAASLASTLLLIH